MQKQQIISVAVLLCIVAVQMSIAQKDIPNYTPVPIEPLVTDVSTVGPIENTESKIPLDGRTIVEPRNIWLSRLFGRQSANLMPKLVVEVDEENNEASLKIMNLPLVRQQKPTIFPNVQNTEVGKQLSQLITETENDSNLPKVRRARDIDFKIYDPMVIQALIDALRKVDPSRAEILQRNIIRAKVKIEIDDDEDDWYMRMQYAMGQLPMF